MRRLVLASCDTITLKTHFMNAVKAAINEGEPAMDNVTIGMDLGDKNNAVYVLDKSGREELSDTIDNNADAIRVFFSQYPGATVAIEAGTHSPWISRQLTSMGCKVLVGNPRKLRVIWDSNDKSDGRDANMLARVARFDPELLYPINHRGEQAQIDLELLQARDILVKNRSSLINHIRGSVKSLGGRLPSCSAESFHRQAGDHLAEELRETIKPLLTVLEQMTTQIKSFDQQIDKISRERYPETELLRAIKGVGPLTSLAFILTLEDPTRFDKSRQVGSFLGLTPRRDQSGEIDKQLRITKAGNPYLRRLLVSAGQYILGPFGEECDLRRFGLRLAARGGKNAKRRAVVAVARKLSVLLHRLWLHGEVYNPCHASKPQVLAKAA
jgi:transposase